MPCHIYFENQLMPRCAHDNVATIKWEISQQFGLSSADLFVTVNGRTAPDNLDLSNTDNVVRIYTKLVGGKGGFGSMLRAIGAQIEKTTNREACRDLSGRRLRDINEEKRLRKWLDGQADREREAEERKQKKIERIIAGPKIDASIHDPVYEKERQELPERVSAAVDAGWEAAGSSRNNTATKRKAVEEKKPKKKAKLWIDADLSDCSSLSGDDEEVTVDKPSPGVALSTDSGNESDPVAVASKRVCWSFILCVSLLVLVSARPQEFEEEEENHASDKHDDVARVQIKVYRGPTKNDGYAPWGFWVKQPSDDDKKK